MLARLRHPAARLTSCLHDASARIVKGDPTGTVDIRRRYRAMSDIRWNKFRAQVKAAIVSQDMLNLDPAKTTSLSLAMRALPDDALIRAFQTWVDKTLSAFVLEGETEWLDPMVTQSYARALVRARRLTNNAKVPTAQSTIHALQQLTLVEMQGIAEAVSQRMVREASNALLDALKPAQLFARMNEAIDKIGVTRTRNVVEVIVIKAHATGTLDQFEAAGVARVGLLPEKMPKGRRLRDGGTPDKGEAPKTHTRAFMGLSDARRSGPGSRISREEVPSGRTIRRIRAVARSVEREFASVNVEVLTAGDMDVCDVCEEIAADGPYSIDRARSLIPAHPNCRCTFVPEGDERFQLAPPEEDLQ